MSAPPARKPAVRAAFATTQWSIVLAARAADPARAQDALATLCSTYWPPLYAYARRLGHEATDAEDLTQGFFVSLMERDALRNIDRGKGRFRTFLVVAFKNFMCNEHDRRSTQKRGAGKLHLSIDAAAAERQLSLAHDRTPEELYHRMWAITLLERVLDRLREEHVRAGKQDTFDRLKAYLSVDGDAGSYANAAADTGASAGALKVAVHRLRRRYRDLLLEEAARTVDDPAAAKEELRELLTILQR